MSLLLVVVFVTLALSAICSLLEAALYSTRIATLEAAHARGQHLAGAAHFLRLKRNIAVPTSAILILNTVANTAGATLAGMLAAEELGRDYIALFSAILTLAILMLSEILPKTFGATHWRTLWPWVVWPIVGLERLLRPFVWLAQKFSSIFVARDEPAATTQDEIVAMMRQGANAGELSATQMDLMEAAIHFEEATVADVMFSRRDAVFFDSRWSLQECKGEVSRSGHTRYPLFEGERENLVGLIHVKDLFGLDEESTGARTLKDHVRPLEHVPDTMPLRTLLQQMQSARPHMVAVVDERGTVVGFATLENVLEELVGSVQDEFDNETAAFSQESDDSILVQGGLSLRRVALELEIPLEHDSAHTVSGFIVSRLGRLPQVGDRVTTVGAHLDVVELGVDQVARVRVVRLDDSPPAPKEEGSPRSNS